MTPFLEASGRRLSFPPRFGEQNREIYGRLLGYSDQRLTQLKTQGII
jgi:crotonobetainyl-CoA:carnitine CoA-transferase CaiB-like acyl-CoA transferase